MLFTPPFTNQNGGEVTFNTASLPPGAHVPVSSTISQMALETPTNASRQPPLNYITTDQDNKTRPYDNTDKNQNSASCGF